MSTEEIDNVDLTDSFLIEWLKQKNLDLYKWFLVEENRASLRDSGFNLQKLCQKLGLNREELDMFLTEVCSISRSKQTQEVCRIIKEIRESYDAKKKPLKGLTFDKEVEEIDLLSLKKHREQFSQTHPSNEINEDEEIEEMVETSIEDEEYEEEEGFLDEDELRALEGLNPSADNDELDPDDYYEQLEKEQMLMDEMDSDDLSDEPEELKDEEIEENESTIKEAEQKPVQEETTPKPEKKQNLPYEASKKKDASIKEEPLELDSEEDLHGSVEIISDKPQKEKSKVAKFFKVASIVSMISIVLLAGGLYAYENRDMLMKQIGNIIPLEKENMVQAQPVAKKVPVKVTIPQNVTVQAKETEKNQNEEVVSYLAELPKKTESDQKDLKKLETQNNLKEENPFKVDLTQMQTESTSATVKPKVEKEVKEPKQKPVKEVKKPIEVKKEEPEPLKIDSFGDLQEKINNENITLDSGKLMYNGYTYKENDTVDQFTFIRIRPFGIKVLSHEENRVRRMNKRVQQ